MSDPDTGLPELLAAAAIERRIRGAIALAFLILAAVCAHCGSMTPTMQPRWAGASAFSGPTAMYPHHHQETAR